MRIDSLRITFCDIPYGIEMCRKYAKYFRIVEKRDIDKELFFSLDLREGTLIREIYLSKDRFCLALEDKTFFHCSKFEYVNMKFNTMHKDIGKECVIFHNRIFLSSGKMLLENEIFYYWKITRSTQTREIKSFYHRVK